MDGTGVIDSIELLRGCKTDARRPAGSQDATLGGLCKPVSGTRLQQLQCVNLNPCVAAPLQSSGSPWGTSSY